MLIVGATKAILLVLLQKSKSAIFDGCNPLTYRDTILDKSVQNWFLQQYRLSSGLTHAVGETRSPAWESLDVQSGLVGDGGGQRLALLRAIESQDLHRHRGAGVLPFVHLSGRLLEGLPRGDLRHDDDRLLALHPRQVPSAGARCALLASVGRSGADTRTSPRPIPRAKTMASMTPVCFMAISFHDDLSWCQNSRS